MSPPTKGAAQRMKRRHEDRIDLHNAIDAGVDIHREHLLRAALAISETLDEILGAIVDLNDDAEG